MSTDTAEATARTYFLTSEELAATKAKVAKVNARAEGRGFTGRFDIEALPATRNYTNAGGVNVTLHGFDVTLTGDAPCYEGWTFVAAVDAVGDSVVIRTAPGARDLTISNDDFEPGVCQHCNTKRIRKHTYLLTDADGTIKQVGKTCMKDFLGWDTFPVFIDDEAAAKDIFGGFSYGGAPQYATLDIARVAFAATDVWGYQNSYAKQPTRGVVTDILLWTKHAPDINAALADAYLTPEEVQARIDEVLASLTETSGFEANLRVVLEAESVEWRQLGIATSVASVWKRLTTKKVEEAVKAAAYQSQHLGTVGQPISVTGVVTMARTIDGYHYNTSQRIIAVSVGKGDIVKMFTTAEWAYDAQEGDTLTIDAMVSGTTSRRPRWSAPRLGPSPRRTTSEQQTQHHGRHRTAGRGLRLHVRGTGRARAGPRARLSHRGLTGRDRLCDDADVCPIRRVEPQAMTEPRMWEILVPTQRNDGRPIRTRFHRVWDEKVKDITGGLTITPPVKGVWVSKSGDEYRERMIPVRILATDDQMERIVDLTKDYYEQLAVLAYAISSRVIMREDDE